MATHTVPTWTRGERMAKAREQAGLTQEEMGARLNVSDKTISAWENETRQPRGMMTVLTRWSDITGVPMWWLLDVRSEQAVRESGWNNGFPGERRKGPSLFYRGVERREVAAERELQLAS